MFFSYYFVKYVKCEGNAAKRTNERLPESEITHDSEPENEK